MLARLLVLATVLNTLLCVCRPAAAAVPARHRAACCASTHTPAHDESPARLPHGSADCPHCRPAIASAGPVAVPAVDFAMPQTTVSIVVWTMPRSPDLGRPPVDRNAWPPAATLLRLHCALNA